MPELTLRESQRAVYQLVVAFTNTMLSAFYFNIVKDTLYTERSDSVARQRVAYVLKQVRHALPHQ